MVVREQPGIPIGDDIGYGHEVEQELHATRTDEHPDCDCSHDCYCEFHKEMNTQASNTSILNLPLLPEVVPDKYESLEDTGHFFLIGPIDNNTVNATAQTMFRQAVKDLYLGRKDRVYRLVINSEGGEVRSAFYMHGIIRILQREFGIKVHTHVCGEAKSAALTIAQCGDWKTADPFSIFHIHDVSVAMSGDAATHGDYMELTAKMRSLIAHLFATNNSKGHDSIIWWIDNYMDRGKQHFLLATEALELGIIDEILE